MEDKEKACLVKSKRKEFKLTQQDLANKLNITKQAVSKIEANGRIGNYTIENLNKVFGINIPLKPKVQPIKTLKQQIAELKEENHLLKVERDSAIQSQKESFEEQDKIIQELKTKVERQKEHIWLLMDRLKKSDDKSPF